MTSMSDNEDLEKELSQLVMETRHGNQESYRLLLEKLSVLLKRGAIGQLNRFGRTAYAEDILQETLLAIHLKLHTYDKNLPFIAWARAVMKHKIIDHLRKNKIKAVSWEDESWEPIDESNPENQAINRDLQKLLNTLKPPTGQIIHAMKVEGASVRELSVQYNLSEANIKVIVHRGLQKLSDMIRKENAA